MEIVHDEESLETYMDRAVEASPERPVLVDRFLLNAVEMDVDAVSDGEEVYIGGVMEHIEYAGIHSGDSACRIPPASLLPETIERIKEETRKLALALNVCGLINIQYAVVRGERGGARSEDIYVLEVNPRASRTVPYVSKATGVPLAKVAARCMVGRSLADQGLSGSFRIKHVAVKEAVLPFVKFRGVDPVLGPEMRSTGEVMGIAPDFGSAFAKSQASAGAQLPVPGGDKGLFISIGSQDEKEFALEIAAGFAELGFHLLATEGTREYLTDHGVEAELVHKIGQGRPNTLDIVKNRQVGLIVNTPTASRQARRDEVRIRRAAVETGTAYTTTLASARACLEALRSGHDILSVKSIQEYLEENR
jgi:carbamoyl-phosphate synthase large subunit